MENHLSAPCVSLWCSDDHYNPSSLWLSSTRRQAEDWYTFQISVWMPHPPVFPYYSFARFDFGLENLTPFSPPFPISTFVSPHFSLPLPSLLFLSMSVFCHWYTQGTFWWCLVTVFPLSVCVNTLFTGSGCTCDDDGTGTVLVSSTAVRQTVSISWWKTTCQLPVCLCGVVMTIITPARFDCLLREGRLKIGTRSKSQSECHTLQSSPVIHFDRYCIVMWLGTFWWCLVTVFPLSVCVNTLFTGSGCTCDDDGTGTVLVSSTAVRQTVSISWWKTTCQLPVCLCGVVMTIITPARFDCLLREGRLKIGTRSKSQSECHTLQSSPIIALLALILDLKTSLLSLLLSLSLLSSLPISLFPFPPSSFSPCLSVCLLPLIYTGNRCLEMFILIWSWKGVYNKSQT